MTPIRQYLKVWYMTRTYSSKAQKIAFNLIERVLTANPIALIVVGVAALAAATVLVATQTALFQ